MSLLFISHSSKDNAQTIAVKHWLEENGWNELFLDLDPHQGILAGEQWKQALIRASNYCEAVILLISDNWLNSTFCWKEYVLAKQLNKRIFPIIISTPKEKSIPSEISDELQIINLELGKQFVVQRVTMPDGSKQDVFLSKEGLSNFKNGLIKAGLHPEFFQWPPLELYDNPPSPYKGLKPLDAEDAGIFFGREADISRLMEELYYLKDKPVPRFMAVLGASGYGKSSFIRAGILPRLARVPAHFLVMPVIRPDREVISGTTGLVNALAKLSEEKQLGYTRKSLLLAMNNVKDALLPIIQQILTVYTYDEHIPALVLTIDQAEELFNASCIESEAFLQLLAILLKEPTVNLIVLCTIRSDSYEALQTAPALAHIPQQTFSLQPILRNAYYKIIEGPAQLLEKTKKPLDIDPLLIETLLKDIEEGGGKDALPLLAFTLERLYQDYGNDGQLTLKEYTSFYDTVSKQQSGLGGLKGAINSAINEALNKAQQDPRVPKDRQACLALLRRGFIPWLAGIDVKTKKPRRKVADYASIPEEARPLIDILVDCRLLTKDLDHTQKITTIEPAHESILRQWQDLDGWLKESEAELILIELLKEEATAWEANKINGIASNEWLRLRGSRLSDLEALLQNEQYQKHITASQQSYLIACRQFEDQKLADELSQAKALAEAQATALERQKQIIKRTRIGAGIMAILLAISVGAGYQTYLHKKQAEELLGEVQRVSTFLNFELRDNIKERVPVHIWTPVVEQIEKLGKLLEKHQSSYQQQRLVMVGYSEKGNLLESQGKLDDALDYYQKALAINESLVKQDPNDQQAQRDLSFSYENLGDIAVKQGSLDKALNYYQRGLEICESFAKQDQSDQDAQRDLSISYNKLGDILVMQGNFDRALSYYQRGLEIRESLAKQDQGDQDAQLDVSSSYERLSYIAEKQGNLDKVLSYNQRELEILENLTKQDSSNQKAQFILYKRLSYIAEKQGNLAKALSYYQKRLQISESLSKQDPSNQEIQRDLSISYHKLGDITAEQGNLDKAIDYYQRGVEISESLSKQDSSNQEIQRGLSISYQMLGDILAKQGNLDKALSYYQQGLEIQESLAKQDLSNQQARRDLYISYYYLGDIVEMQGNLDRALDYYQQGFEISESLAKQDLGNQQAQRDLVFAYWKLGNITAKQGNLDKALGYYQRGFEISESLVKQNPSNQQAQRDFLVMKALLEKLSKDQK
ncbi:photosystem I assembly protein Ycf3 [Actinobacillus indolicus]|nr:photosystem I assembly protein Ycf3 [Actinobacillus indolicus]VTU08498.1 photosystem I assembly protein Ycf3 [Actinobacillus indolicus]